MNHLPCLGPKDLRLVKYLNAPSIFRKLNSQIQIDEATNCWNWTGKRNVGGYGLIRINGRTFIASRVAWTLINGEPGSLFVLHKCDNPPCINPLHLFLGSHKDNSADMVRKGRSYGAKLAKQKRDEFLRTQGVQI